MLMNDEWQLFDHTLNGQYLMVNSNKTSTSFKEFKFEKLTIIGCTNLVEVHDFVGFVDKLSYLSIIRCSLPFEVFKMPQVEIAMLYLRRWLRKLFLKSSVKWKI